MKNTKKIYAAFVIGLLLVLVIAGIYYYSTKPSPRSVAVAALVNGDFNYLENKLNNSQQGFEQKKQSVKELHEEFEDLSELDRLIENSIAEQRLNEWVSKFPNSYVAKTIRGNYFADMADIARGELSATKTTEKQFSEMRRFHQLALTDLDASLKLTKLPLVSHIRLISMNTTAGNNVVKDENFLKVLAISPANMLLHEQMLYSLLPRWGGSYDAMYKYIETVSPKLESQRDKNILASIITADAADGLMRLEKYAESYALYSEVINLRNICLDQKLDSEKFEITKLIQCKLSKIEIFNNFSIAPSSYLCSRAYIGYKLKKESSTIVKDLQQAGMKTNPAVYCTTRVEIFAIENVQSNDTLPLLETYLTHFPKNPELHSAKGWVMQERGDQPSAYKSFLKSAELGGLYGQTMAGKYLFSGWGGPVDRDKAMIYLKKAAEKGEKNAQLSMVQALQFLGRNDESIKLKLLYEAMPAPAKN
jgi:Domain of unknown function (DUF4034)